MVGLDSLTGGMGGFLGSAGTILKWCLYLSPILILIIWLIVYFRNRTIYVHPVRIFRLRENGKTLESNFKGGYIGRKNSAPFFRIKTGKWWWQYLDLIKTPNPKYLDEQNRVYYLQIDIDTFVQLRREFGKTSFVLTAVEPDVKYGAILKIQRIKDVLRQKSLLSTLAPYFGLIILFITAIIGWWFVMDSKCPSIG